MTWLHVSRNKWHWAYDSLSCRNYNSRIAPPNKGWYEYNSSHCLAWIPSILLPATFSQELSILIVCILLCRHSGSGARSLIAQVVTLLSWKLLPLPLQLWTPQQQARQFYSWLYWKKTSSGVGLPIESKHEIATQPEQRKWRIKKLLPLTLMRLAIERLLAANSFLHHLWNRFRSFSGGLSSCRQAVHSTQ